MDSTSYILDLKVNLYQFIYLHNLHAKVKLTQLYSQVIHIIIKQTMVVIKTPSSV